jgi:hypothetical protein
VGFTDLTFFWLQIFLNAQGHQSQGGSCSLMDFGDGLTGRQFQCVISVAKMVVNLEILGYPIFI